MGNETGTKALEELNFDVTRDKIAIASTQKIIPGREAIVRTDNQKVLGIVSNNYRLIKHGDAMVGPAKVLIEEGYEIKRAYQAKEGAKAILQLQSTDTTKLNDEDYKTTLYLLNSYDGSTSLRMQFGLFRLICLNGMGYWKKGEVDKECIVHLGENKLFNKDVVLNFVENTRHYTKSVETIIARLGDYKLSSDEDAATILNKLNFGKRTVKQTIEEWKKDINYKPNLAGLLNGITSYWTRKVEVAQKNAGGKLINANWYTNKAIHKLHELAVN